LPYLRPVQTTAHQQPTSKEQDAPRANQPIPAILSLPFGEGPAFNILKGATPTADAATTPLRKSRRDYTVRYGDRTKTINPAKGDSIVLNVTLDSVK
jgi:hypothetical protein